MSSSTSQQPKVNPQLQQQYNAFKLKILQTEEKISQLQSECDEHNLVVQTLSELDDERKCYRMIGGILVEKMVKETIPVLNSTIQGLTGVIEQLRNEYSKTITELQKWQKENKVQIVQTD